MGGVSCDHTAKASIQPQPYPSAHEPLGRVYECVQIIEQGLINQPVVYQLCPLLLDEHLEPELAVCER